MHYLVKNFGLFVGDLITSNNKHWQLYLIMRKIVCVAIADAINEKIIENFEKLVDQYLISHKQLFKCNFKFKHHILLHYPRIMRALGPLKNMSSMRYEAKHKQIKETSKIITSRKNPSYSLAVKHQLQFGHRLVRNIGFSDDLSYGTPFVIVKLTSQFESFKEYLPSHNFFYYNCYSWVRINGMHYEVNNVINYSKNDFDVSLGKIKFIIISSEKEIFFCTAKFKLWNIVSV